MRPFLSRILAVAVVGTISAGVALGPAVATYPGSNGDIVYATDGGVRAMSDDGSGDHVFTTLGGFIGDVAFSADGTKAAVVDSTGRGDRIVLLDLPDDIRRVVLSVHRWATEIEGALSSVALAPHARRIAFSDGSYPRHLYTIHVDGSELTMIAKGYADADWGSNGRIVASKGIFHFQGKRLITTMDPNGRNKTLLATFPPVNDSWTSVYELVPSWSPDASAVVFAAQRYRITPDIWWVASDGSNLHKLTDSVSESEAGPVFSPDGTEIVFSRVDPPSDDSDLWLMDPTGGNLTQLTDTPASFEYPLAWQPN